MYKFTLHKNKLKGFIEVLITNNFKFLDEFNTVKTYRNELGYEAMLAYNIVYVCRALTITDWRGFLLGEFESVQDLKDFFNTTKIDFKKIL